MGNRAVIAFENEPQKEDKTMTDFHIYNYGSLYLLDPRTDAADTWVDDCLPEDCRRWNHAVVVEPRYIGDICQGIIAEGMTIS